MSPQSSARQVACANSENFVMWPQFAGGSGSRLQGRNRHRLNLQFR